MSRSSPIATIGEFGWLRRLVPRLFWPRALRPQLCIGAGDDAGVLWISRSRALVASTDAMVEGIHFERRWTPWETLGEKVLSVNLSDLAAMGAVKPLAALVTAAFPGDTPVDSVDKFHRGLEACARRWKTGLLGGDTVGSKRDWFVSVTVLGEADPKQLVRRDGARLGDLIVSSGPLGLAAAGLEVLQAGKQRLAWTRPLVEAFRDPQPQFRTGRLLGLRRWATSLMDCSDGLTASARFLAEASGNLGVELRVEKEHIAPALWRWAAGRRRDPRDYVLHGGEDYQLIFTVAPARWARARLALPGAQVLGQMTRRGRGQKFEGYGFAHFG